jgi:hypothetical protein
LQSKRAAERARQSALNSQLIQPTRVQSTQYFRQACLAVNTLLTSACRAGKRTLPGSQLDQRVHPNYLGIILRVFKTIPLPCCLPVLTLRHHALDLAGPLAQETGSRLQYARYHKLGHSSQAFRQPILLLHEFGLGTRVSWPCKSLAAPNRRPPRHANSHKQCMRAW